MNRERLTAVLNDQEDCNLNRHVVDDTDHIGWGINLEESLADELLEYLGVEDEDDIQTITQEQADYLRDWFIDNAIKDCYKIYGTDFFNGLSDVRREVLTNLSYNLGINRLKGFRKMNKAVLAQDWTEAAVQMLDSKAARQTGDRYQKLSGAFEHDDESYFGLSSLYDLPENETESVPIGSLTDAEIIAALENISTEVLLIELARRTGVAITISEVVPYDRS